MGTRGAVGFYVDGQTKVTYNHFDSYPEGLGKDTVQKIAELLAKHDKLSLIRLASDIRLLDESEKPSEEMKDKLREYTDLTVSNDWYCLFRSAQGKIDAYLNIGYMPDGNDFLKDSLFCEYAYIINLDDFTFECYEGFQHDLHDKGRYASKTPDGDYYPVKLVGTFPLDNIPDDWAKVYEDEEDKELCG